MGPFSAGWRRLSSIKWSSYVLAWAFITLNGSGMCVIMYNVAQRTFMSSAHYKKALELFDEHDQAKQKLGEPVKVGKLNMFDKRHNYLRKTESSFHVPVCGTHSSGFVNVFANKKPDESAFTTQRLVLELEDGERFLMFERPTVEEQKRRKEEEETEKAPKKRPRGR